MADAASELAHFNQFALARLNDGVGNRSLDELFDEWRQENPSAEDLKQTLSLWRRRCGT